MDTSSDAELLTRVATGDRIAAVGLLYDRHGPAVWNAAPPALGDPQQAEDITVHVFQWMERHAGRLATVDRPLALVLRVEGVRARSGLRPPDVPQATSGVRLQLTRAVSTRP